MSIKRAGTLAVLAALFFAPAVARACETGQVLTPGDSCELTVKWGFDHWITAEFPEGGGNQVEFSHLEGTCSVSLFGPIEAGDPPLLGPNEGPFRTGIPGEYHLFTRAIVVAQQACRYRVAVN